MPVPDDRQNRHHRDGHHSHHSHLGTSSRRVDRQNSLRSQSELVTVRPKQSFASDKNSTQRVDIDTDLYAVDRKGDSQNLLYGGLSRYSIPRHRAAGFGRVLGLDDRFRIGAEGVEDVSGDPGVRSKRTGKSLLSTLALGGGEPLTVKTTIPEAGLDAIILQSDYVAIGDRRGRKRRRVQHSHSFDKTTDISLERSLQRDSETDSTSSSNQDNVDSNTFDTFKEDPNQLRLLELERKSREYPQDVESWLSLIAHQDVMQRNSYDIDPSSRKFSNHEKANLAELKISIYERGLDKVYHDEGRERLAIGMMTEGEKIWDKKKLFEKWGAILNEFAVRTGKHSQKLWTKYLNLRQTNFATFSVESSLKLYQVCLNSAAELDNNMERDEWRIFLFLRATIMLIQAGFMERSVAMWQAEIEWVYFPPEESSSDEEAFEKWWEGEAARFGEQGAKGWKTHDNRDFQATPLHEVKAAEKGGESKLESWALYERHQSLCWRMPARTLDEVLDDDPYRIVLFSDIKNFLFRPAGLEGRQLLLDAFLLLCDLPPFFTSSRGVAQEWWIDPFVRHVNILPRKLDAEKTQSSSETFRETPPLAYFSIDSTTLFADPHLWFIPWPSLSASHSNKVNEDWRARSIRQLVEVVNNDEVLAEYAIALELHTNLPNVRKFAKALLRKRPGSLRLYNAFALVECRTGKFEAAENVWATALSMSQSFHQSLRKDATLLWRSWIWELLDRREFGRAEGVLIAIPDGKAELTALEASNEMNSIPASTRLRVQRHLELQLSQNLQHREYEQVVHTTDLLAVLCYLTTGHSLPTAIGVYQRSLDALSIDNPTYSSASTAAEELLHQSQARLTHLQAINATKAPGNPTPNTTASSILSSSLQLFPANTIFLTLSNHYTRRPHLLDRLRSTLLPDLHSPLIPNPASPDPCAIIQSLFHLTTEATRPTYAGRTTHSVRAAFSRVLNPSPLLSSSQTSGPSSFTASVALHLTRLDWELSLLPPLAPNQNHTPAALAHLRSAFHAALHAIPWCKELYLKAFTEHALRAAIGGGGRADGAKGEGLRELYESMVEKGLRLFREM